MPIVFVRVEVPDSFNLPGVIVGQVLREVAPYMERMQPLDSGSYPDRQKRQIMTEWTVVQIGGTYPEEKARK